uniref:CS domain-containing protein n=1 Tax=Periophthalmus magnuspinnatus TaxID=409849 RepID=A0A3B3ZKA6_9GOBI
MRPRSESGLSGDPTFSSTLERSQPAHAYWFDRKKYVTVNFVVQKPKDVKVDIQTDKMILYCKNEEEDVFYNELHFFDKVQINVSTQLKRVYDRTINVLLRKIKPDFAWPRLQKNSEKPSWISVDFDNWRDWEHEEDDGKEEYDRYMDVKMSTNNKGPAPDMDDLSDVSKIKSSYVVVIIM